MYLQRNRVGSTGRVSLSLIHRGVDRSTGKSCVLYYQYLGYEDELQKEYPDPAAHFSEVAEHLNEEMRKYGPKVLLERTGSKMPVGTDSGKNLGVFCQEEFLESVKRISPEL